ncbi:MAG: DUF4038 domain-containing protein [Cyclobacteriaceae bacterium]|nr:DUF4038 domain-containing protein [Cyclobacteriaceae bacterium]
MIIRLVILSILFLVVVVSCRQTEELTVEQWDTYEISLIAQGTFTNPYTDVDVWAEFTNDDGLILIRPAFWDGGNTWKIRFAVPDESGQWTWKSFCSVADQGLSGKNGTFRSIPYSGSNQLVKHGLLRMSPGKRNVVHADGTPFLVIGDTPWAIPFRATTEQVKVYAQDRQQKGFNAALLMSVQPDRYAEGPDKRDTVLGFARAFDDLPEGHLNKIRVDYFQYLDQLMNILVDHEIVPVFQPVFHGFGWKGKTVLGSTALPEEYARYCRYLVARYGSKPALWLVGGDGNGLAPGIKPGGAEIEKWDAYQQPTGIHYSPCDDYLAPWAATDSTLCLHYFRAHQAEPWLDFQWAQTGHDGKHLAYKLERMYNEKPTKAVLNGEPTYEGMQGGKAGLGWWQGHEAWSNLINGGTMGVVYGAATLWQWKYTPDESGWENWTDQNTSWREAIGMEGSTYVGHVRKVFQGLDFADMEMRKDLTENNHPVLVKEGKFYITYLPNGSTVSFKSLPGDMMYRWFDPVKGEFTEQQEAVDQRVFTAPDQQSWVLVINGN